MTASRPPGGAARPRAGFDLFSVAGIRITVDYSWFFILFLVSWAAWRSLGLMLEETSPGPVLLAILSLGAALLLFLSVLVHELAHSLVARSKGVPVPRITLFMFGGVSQLGREPDRPADEFQIAIVGPLASFAIGAFGVMGFLVARRLELDIAAALVGHVAIINIALGLFNLVPAYPLDGGRVLRAALWGSGRSITGATVAAAGVGKVLALGLMGLGIGLVVFGGNFAGLWWVLIGLFVRQAAAASARQAVLRRDLSGTPVSALMRPPLAALLPSVAVSTAVEQVLAPGRLTVCPVLDRDRLVGMLFLDDVERLPAAERDRRTVGDVMTPRDRLTVVRPGDDTVDVLERLLAGGREALAVLDGERLVGLVSRADILSYLRLQTLRHDDAPR